jgi:hypothetical protein
MFVSMQSLFFVYYGQHRFRRDALRSNMLQLRLLYFINDAGLVRRVPLRQHDLPEDGPVYGVLICLFATDYLDRLRLGTLVELSTVPSGVFHDGLGSTEREMF